MIKEYLTKLNPYVKWGIVNFIILYIIFLFAGETVAAYYMSKQYTKTTESRSNAVKTNQQISPDTSSGVSHQRILEAARMSALNEAKQRSANSASVNQITPLTQKDFILAGIEISNSLSQVEQKLGVPLQTQKSKDYRADKDYIVYTYPKDVKVITEKGKIIAVSSSNNTISTNRNIGIDATAAQIFAAYGKTASTPFNSYDLYEYEGNTAIVLRFAVGKSSQKVEYIMVRLK
jgi:hypothetical protein